MKVALVYDRLNKVGGAEVVLIALQELFPQAVWHTSVWDAKSAPFSRSWQIRSSFLTRIPFLRKRHELIPFLMPFIFESFDFSPYDLVISVGSAEAKGIITRPETLHLNYCLTPTRYLWSHQNEYLSRPQFGLLQKLATPLIRFVFRFLRRWDLVASSRPDIMISISEQVKKRVKKHYKRDSQVIYPPVHIERYAVSQNQGDYYLTVSRLVPYKHLDLLVKIFRGTGRKLVIVGSGTELARLKKLATSNIIFTGHVADKTLLKYYQECRAFVQVNTEDFGLAMVEAQASGKPVIAYKEGGAGEIVRPGETGLLVESSTVKAFRQAIDKFETMKISSSACQKNASRFAAKRWQQDIKQLLGVYGYQV